MYVLTASIDGTGESKSLSYHSSYSGALGSLDALQRQLSCKPNIGGVSRRNDSIRTVAFLPSGEMGLQFYLKEVELKA